MARVWSTAGTYAPVFLIFLSVVGLGASAWFLVSDAAVVGALWVGTLPSAAAAVIVARRSSEETRRERRLRSAIEADRLTLEEERAAFLAERSSTQQRLALIETSLVDRAAALDWTPSPAKTSRIEPAELKHDETVERLIDDATERVFDALREGKYVRQDRFESRLFWEDVGALVRDVAAVYQPGADKAWLEVDARQLAIAAHRTILRVSLRLEQAPAAPPSRKLSDIVRWTETYRSGQSLLEYAKPLMDYTPWLYRLVRVLAGANPATLGLSVIVFELVKKAGFRVSVDVMERYFKGIVRDFMTAVGQEAANVYGGAYGRRSKVWITGAEAVYLARQASESRPMLTEVVRLLDELDFRDEIDRRALQRALVAPQFEPQRADWMAIEDRTEVLERIEALYASHPTAMSAKTLAKWKAGLEARLGHRSRLEARNEDVHAPAQLESIAHSLARWALARGLPKDALEDRLRDAQALVSLEDQERDDLILGVIEQIGDGQTPIDDAEAALPRFDLTEAQTKAYVDDLLGLMTRLRPWGPTPDLELLDEVARRFRVDGIKLRTRLGAGYVSALAEHLQPQSPLKKLPPGAAYAALVCLETEEEWDFIEDGKRIMLRADADKTDKAALRTLQRELSRGAGMWLLVSTRRAILLRKTEVQTLSASAEQVWEGRFEDPSVRVEQPGRWGWRTPTAHGGRWRLPDETVTASDLALEIGRAGAQRLLEGIAST